MEEDMLRVFLLLLFISSAIALVGLWFISARSRQRRISQLHYMGVNPPSTRPAKNTLGDRKIQKYNTGVVTVKRECENTGEVFTFFFETVLSSGHPCHFKMGNVVYSSVEQYVMHQKAVIFENPTIAHEIRISCDLNEQKLLGSQVKNFDPVEWRICCKDIVKRGNMAKFSQNEQLKHDLLSTAGTTLVEASACDCVWGIGLGAYDPKATDRTKWRGSNWLGEILTEVRDKLISEQNADSLLTPKSV